MTWQGETVHIVGLGIDPGDEVLQAGLAATRSGRVERAKRMSAVFDSLGIEGTFEGASRLAGNPRMISRTHYARYLCDAGHVKSGRANGRAAPRISHEKPAACLIDAQGGLAYLAMELAVREAKQRTRVQGAAFCGVTNSHHCGAMDHHLMPLAEAGLIGIGFTNSPAAINASASKRAALACPTSDGCSPVGCSV